jgi:hypothetical protein
MHLAVAVQQIIFMLTTLTGAASSAMWMHVWSHTATCQLVMARGRYARSRLVFHPELQRGLLPRHSSCSPPTPTPHIESQARSVIVDMECGVINEMLKVSRLGTALHATLPSGSL